MKLVKTVRGDDEFHPKVGDVHLCRGILAETDDLNLCLRDVETGKNFRSDPLPSNKTFNYRRKYLIDEMTTDEEPRVFVKFTVHEDGDRIDANEFAPFNDSSNFKAIK